MTTARRFLVEVYLPRSAAGGLAAAGSRAKDAATGAGARYVRAMYVPEDEICFYVFEAPTREIVAEAVQCAGLVAARVTEALETPKTGGMT
jgi:hypothetical protein